MQKTIQVSDHRQVKRLFTGLLGLTSILTGFILSIKLGAIDITISEIISVLKADKISTNYNIIWNIRLPRIIAGALVGINLALSGAILQGVLRNPIADPGIIGVSAGAGLFAVTIMILFPEHTSYVPMGAFLGAILASMIVYLISWRGGVSPLWLILAGVAVASFFGAFLTNLMVFHSDKVQGTINWMAGGLQGRSWKEVNMILPYTIVGFVASLTVYRYLNILMLGDDIARGLGMRVELTRLGYITLSAFLAASAVSVAGLLGFVGLITPHAVRLIVGSDYKYLLPFSALFGALLIIWADTAARMAFAPIEIPVGVFMAFIGAPFFLYLLHSNIKK
ncbi:MAG: iron ABC transporter permease [Thermodesulfovibrionales bacterium]|nr:iron ABC transporter permease [Thermodesulfovibrionales bacterium]